MRNAQLTVINTSISGNGAYGGIGPCRWGFGGGISSDGDGT